MQYWDFKRSSASVRLVMALAQEQGLDAASVLAHSRLTPTDLDDPNIEIEATQELCVVSNLIRLCPQPGLGLALGLRYNFASYGLWGLGLISSATVGDALSLALRFIPLTFLFCRISGDVEGDAYVFTYEAPDLPPELQRFLLERDMAAAARLMKETLGPAFALSRATFTHHLDRRARSLDDFERLTGIQAELGSSRNTLSFDRRLLALPLPQANPVTVAMCERACEDLMVRRRARLGVAASIRQYLAATPIDSTPDLSQAARAMGFSDRTLKRRLQHEGITFRQLLAEVRGQYANQLLADETLSLTEIAERMGFSDLSSFSQAYKRWFGVAPSAGRAAMMAD